MRKIIIVFETGNTIPFPPYTNFKLLTPKKIDYYEFISYSTVYADIDAVAGSPSRDLYVMSGNTGLTFRSGTIAVASDTARALNYVTLFGPFESDNLKITSDNTAVPYTGRLEVRNENGVLITDNGVPWGDGTYPPDAKNRAGLTGLHAAPAVINSELETALMGDETDKERVQE